MATSQIDKLAWELRQSIARFLKSEELFEDWIDSIPNEPHPTDPFTPESFRDFVVNKLENK